MAGRNAAAGVQQVVDLLRHQRAVREIERLARAFAHPGDACADGVVELAPRHVLVLHHVLADDAPALPRAYLRRGVDDGGLLEPRHVRAVEVIGPHRALAHLHFAAREVAHVERIARRGGDEPRAIVTPGRLGRPCHARGLHLAAEFGDAIGLLVTESTEPAEVDVAPAPVEPQP